MHSKIAPSRRAELNLLRAESAETEKEKVEHLIKGMQDVTEAICKIQEEMQHLAKTMEGLKKQ